MVKRLSYRIITTLVAMSAACSTDDIPAIDSKDDAWHAINIIAKGDDTRTELREAEGRAVWSEGDKLLVFENHNYAVSAAAQIQHDGKASFGVTFPKTATPPYDYNAIYPASSYFDASWNNDITSLKLTLSATQCATTTSFDASTDLLIAKQIETSEQPTTLMMRFKRIVATNKLMFKGLPSSGTISRVIFTVPNKSIAGLIAANIPTGEVVEYGALGSEHSEIVINYTTPISTSTPIYFNSFPIELTAGDSFSVKVFCGGVTYTKSVTLAEGKTLRLNASELNTLTVDMSKVLPVIPESYTPGTLYDRDGIKGIIFAVKDFPVYNSDYTTVVGYDSYCYIFSLDEEDLQWSTKYEWCNAISQHGESNTTRPFDYFGLNINDYPAFKWCRNHGEGWFLPSSTELNWLWEAITDGERDFSAASVAKYNTLIETNGGEPFVETYYWSSNETSESLVEVIAFMNDSVVCLNPTKDNTFTARAVYRFKIQ